MFERVVQKLCWFLLQLFDRLPSKNFEEKIRNFEADKTTKNIF